MRCGTSSTSSACPTSSSSIRRSRAIRSISPRLRGPEGSRRRHAVPADADRTHHRHRKSRDPRAGIAPNYWNAAWQARHFVDERAHRTMPRETISLAINSASGRTQNQLHIHIDCVRLDVQAALREHAGAIGTAWAPFPVKLVRPRLHGDAHRPAGPCRRQPVRPARRRHPGRARRHGALHAGRGRRPRRLRAARRPRHQTAAPARSCRTTPAPPAH